MALDKGLITRAQLKEALANQETLKGLGLEEKLGTILRKKKWLSKDDFDALLTEQKAGRQKRLGNFEVFEKIGQGGMGVVFRARQISMDRIVALKILSPKFANDKEFIERFIREARAAGQFSHVNIVTAVDVGYAKPYHYFAMEYVEGENLLTRLKRKGKFTETEAVDYVLQVAQGLEHALHKKIIHRDVKPENIMLTPQATAKLLDMGLACAVGTGADVVAEKKSGKNKRITKIAKAVGTPHYISPEAARGSKDIDTRADIYSLGCTFYHFLTGSPPYTEGKGRQIMVKHLMDPFPDVRALFPEVSPAVVQVLKRMTARDKSDRYDNPGMLLDDLRAIQENEPLVHAGGGAAKSKRLLPGSKGTTRSTTGPRKPISPSGRSTTGPRRPITLKGQVTTGPRRPVRPKGTTTGPARPVAGDRTGGQAALSVKAGAREKHAPRKASKPNGLLIFGGVAAVLLVGAMAMSLGGRGSGRSGVTDASRGSRASRTDSNKKHIKKTRADVPVAKDKQKRDAELNALKKSNADAADQKVLQDVLAVMDKHRDDFVAQAHAVQRALEAFKGDSLRGRGEALLQKVQGNWEVRFDEVLLEKTNVAHDKVKNKKYKVALATFDADQVSDKFRCFDWESKLILKREQLRLIVVKDLDQQLKQAEKHIQEGGHLAYREAIIEMDRILQVPASLAGGLLDRARKNRDAWKTKLGTLREQEQALERARAKELMVGVRKELAGLLRSNKLTQALDRLDEHIRNRVLLSAREQLKAERQDLIAIQKLRNKAMLGLLQKIGQQVTLHAPIKVTGKVQKPSSGSKGFMLKMAGGFTVGIEAGRLSVEDVETYAVMAQGAGQAEDFRARGLLFLAAGDLEKAEAYFKKAKTAGLENQLKPYFARIEIMRIGETEVRARAAWAQVDRLYQAKKWKEAAAAYRAFQDEHSASIVLKDNANVLQERLAKIASILNPVKAGLKATFYKERAFKKEDVLLTRIDSVVNFNWGKDTPGEGLPADKFCVRWDGLIKIKEAGTYTFAMVGDDGVRMWIGEQQPFTTGWSDHGSARYSGKLNLKKGWHPIRLEYYENGGDAVCELYWALEGGFADQIIPATALVHNPGKDPRALPANP